MDTFIPPSDTESAKRELREIIAALALVKSDEASASRLSAGHGPVDAAALNDGARWVRLTQELVGEMPPQPATLRGRFGAWLIRKIRRALFWYTPRILEFHRSVTASLEQQLAALLEVSRETAAQGLRLQTLEEAVNSEKAERECVRAWAGAEVAALRNAIGEFAGRCEDHFSEAARQQESLRELVANQNCERCRETERTVVSLKRALLSQERRLNLVLEECRKSLAETSAARIAEFIKEESHARDALYADFEDQFRGLREDIKDRLRVYVPRLRSGGIGGPGMPVLDIGCGRGEWLELLGEEQIDASGVDANRAMVAHCLERKLRAVESDAIAHLRSLESASIGSVTGFHIIEHLPYESLVTLLDETVRVLKEGGVAIFETPNPANLLVATERFYFDPTHHHPLPSPLMKFLVEARGLCHVEIVELHPCPEILRLPDDGSVLVKRLNDFFYGPQDYAVIGWKV